MPTNMTKNHHSIHHPFLHKTQKGLRCQKSTLIFFILSKTKKCSKYPKLLKHSIYPINPNNGKEKMQSNTCKKSTYGVKYKYIGNNIRKIKKTRVFCKKSTIQINKF